MDGRGAYRVLVGLSEKKGDDLEDIGFNGMIILKRIKKIGWDSVQWLDLSHVTG